VPYVITVGMPAEKPGKSSKKPLDELLLGQT
jgi:hypothetical protein